MIDVLILYAFYSMPITLGKGALNYVQPFFLIACRMLISAPLMLGYVYFFKRKDFRCERAHWSLFAQVIIFQMYFGFVLLFWALQYTSSSKNAIFFSFTPFITAILCYFLYNEKMTVKKIIGLSIGFLGSLPILLTNDQDASTAHFYFLSFPEIITLIAITCFAYGWIVTAQLSKKYGYSSMMLNGVNMLIGGILILFSSFFMDSWNPLPYSSFWPFVGYTLAMVIAGNFIASNLYAILLRKYTATFIAFVSFTEPIYVAFYSWLWLSETVSWQFYISLVGIFIGLYIFYKEELRQKYVKPLI
jgi:drug/metabolite transporter (DMT)-like permease